MLLALLPFGLLGPLLAASAGEVVQAGPWELHSSFWMSLHQTLIDEAMRSSPRAAALSSAAEQADWKMAVDAYRAAGEYVVNSCDLLIAIWDGQPGRGRGGTEDILRMARNNQMPIYVIGAEPPFGIEEERVPTGFRLLQDVERFDRGDVPQQEERAGDPVSTLIGDAGNEGRILRSCLTWVEPTFARAESIAGRNHVAFVRTSRLVFLMSALATIAVALSVVTEGTMQTVFASLEVALMAGAFVAWLYVRRGLHPRWITARFLAERLRSAAFLAFVGSDDDGGSRRTSQRAERATRQSEVGERSNSLLLNAVGLVDRGHTAYCA